jgi:predicted Zn-dependent peptidase
VEATVAVAGAAGSVTREVDTFRASRRTAGAVRAVTDADPDAEDVVADAAAKADRIQETRLSNGIRVVTERMPEVRSVTVGAWVGVGARDEPAALAGASHFLEHLLFKGTPTRSARDIAEAVDAVGGDINAFTAYEYTTYLARLAAERLDVGLDILGDVLTEPAFRPDELEAERQVILEEILMHLDMPDSHVHVLLAEAMFPDHALGREVLGTRDTVEAIGRQEVADFFGHWYRPANITVVAAGRLDHDSLVEKVDKSLGTLAGGERPVRDQPAATPITTPVVHTEDTEQAHVALGWRGVDHHDGDRYALAVVNQILGGGMASRLFQEVREQRGLCYSVYSWAQTYDDVGSVGIYAGTNPARLPELMSVLDDEVSKLIAGGVTEAELDRAKGCIEGSTVLTLEASEERMIRLGRSLVTRGEVLTVDQQLARLRAVTAADVARVVEKVFGGPRSLAVIGPVDASAFG